ncbi:MAG TPA: CRISPR-associated ring nuclease Csm6 [Dissulfurispiraceae bacterium]|nr:CRISPR-associated ring nuclease Csm6 [Dissulfurispiraceae bacterium]
MPVQAVQRACIYRQEVFIFIAGATPQIISETIYALSQQHPPVYPDEIIVITTAAGYRVLKKTLLASNVLADMQADYQLPSIPLTESSFIIPRKIDGHLLDDVRTPEDNGYIGETIFATVRGKTSDPETRLHCSLAGGRKTMSFYLGAAMQLFGRPHDRLYHVLVAEQYESRPDFFYPSPGSRKKKTIVELADLPFLRLRGKVALPETSFRDLIAESQRAIDQAIFIPDLAINLSERTVHIGSATFELEPSLLMVYVLFLLLKRARCRHMAQDHCNSCHDCFVTLDVPGAPANLGKVAEIWRQIHKPRSFKAEDFIAAHKDGLGADLLRQYISKLNRRLRERISDEAVQAACVIRTIRKYGASRYGVALDRQKILIT